MRIGRRRRADVGTYVELPAEEIAPIGRIVEDGLILYLAAARLAVKNQIIVSAVGRHADYDIAVVEEAVRQELDLLARENEETATRLDEAWGAAPAPSPESEPGSGSGSDAASGGGSKGAASRSTQREQRRRADVLRRIAAILREREQSAASVRELADRARQDAVEETLGAIAETVSHNSVARDANYEAERDQRIDDFVKLDLRAELRRLRKTRP